MNISKQIILLILFSLSIHLSAQKVVFEPVFVNQKTNEIDTSVFFSIRNQNDSDIAWNEFSNVVELPDTGMYKMRINMMNIIYEINIEGFGYSTDTFFVPLYNLVYHISNPPKVDYYCGKWGEEEGLCNGKLVDYYYNGNIHLIGNFKNGQPVDTLKKYYENGVLKFIEYYSPNKYVRKKPYLVLYFWGKYYDKEGNCTSEYDNITGHEIGKYYYPNGNLKEIIDFTDRNNFEEYYENGNPKLIWNAKQRKEYRENGILIYEETNRKRKDYFEDGTLSVLCHARKLPSKDKDFPRYHIRFKRYDSTGRYLQKGMLVNAYELEISHLKWVAFKKIIHNTNPKRKEVISKKNIYENNRNIGYKAIKTVYQKQRNKWEEIEKEEETYKNIYEDYRRTADTTVKITYQKQNGNWIEVEKEEKCGEDIYINDKYSGYKATIITYKKLNADWIGIKKEEEYRENIYKNNYYSGYKSTITTYEKQNDNWVEVERKEE